ncbi:hypothetical protein [Cytobacillus firmus]|nr:hypothetical protein [Cytobacillus firmus]MED1938920.1 hypothetical protein [Cytobacillus firmus]
MKQKKERRRAGYYLLYRKENTHKVWLYEYLQKHEIRARERDGWRVVR